MAPTKHKRVTIFKLFLFVVGLTFIGVTSSILVLNRFIFTSDPSYSDVIRVLRSPRRPLLLSRRHLGQGGSHFLVPPKIMLTHYYILYLRIYEHYSLLTEWLYGNPNLAQDDIRNLDYIRKYHLSPPSKKAYVLRGEAENPSLYGIEISRFFKHKVKISHGKSQLKIRIQHHSNKVHL
jgi:hypothetical protein